MRQNSKFILLFVALVLLAFSAGCSKKPTPIATAAAPDRPAPPPDRPKPAPTISLEAAPNSIERGGQSTLSWQSTNASSIVIDNGVGNVAESGSIIVSPLESATYTAVASGPGGDARAIARVTVVMPRTDVPVASTDADEIRKAIADGRVADVFFDYDKADLTSRSMDTLKKNAIVFRQFPNARIVIEGHCDERGTEEYNLALGDRRALAARDYLIQQGVDAGRLETISFGEERPFDTGHDEAAWAKNRRAHFVPR